MKRILLFIRPIGQRKTRGFMLWRLFLGLLTLAFATSAVAQGHLLVLSYGTLLAFEPSGAQTQIAERVITATLSPDGKYVAYTTDAGNLQVLLVVTLGSGMPIEIARLPKGAYFGEIGWAPDGKALAYQAIVQGKSNNLSLAPFPPTGSQPRNLGHWYQGFSFSPDGSQLVHAVNLAEKSGLEVVDLRGGKRSLLHTTRAIVWDAEFSPDGRSIAYRMTLHEPERVGDDPDCTGPTLGLWVYSLADHSDRQMVVRSAPKEWGHVANFRWSPDSKSIALTLGVAGCEYPGDVATVFLTTLDEKTQKRLSTTGMAFEPVFPPDGSAVAFVDFSDSPARLMRYDIATGKAKIIRIATEQNNHYSLLDWK